LNNFEQHARLRAFDWINEQLDIFGEVLPRKVLETGFIFEGKRIPLVSPQGIFKPKLFKLPLSITTSPKGPYSDNFTPNGLLAYKYRGTDPMHSDNTGLRHCIQTQTPLIYFHGIVPSRYLAAFPVFIVGDNPTGLTFSVAVDDSQTIKNIIGVGVANYAQASEASEARRAYITTTTRRRLHQHTFRERVMQAYRKQCALCNLRHVELLDAAHIIPDSDEKGEPVVSNGISLCKIHHAAFDRFILGITPDYRAEIREDILEEEDGPMLQHGLKELHNRKIIVPRSNIQKPNRDSLEIRYEQFKNYKTR